jgi:hypothetical protein
VAKHNTPFREAHHIVGSLVGDLHRAGKDFSDFDYCLYHIIHKHGVKGKRTSFLPILISVASPDEIKAVLDPKSVMMSYNSLGGTGPIAVREMLEDFNEQLAQHRKVVEADRKRLTDALATTRSIAEKAHTVKTAADLKNLIPAEYRS